ncbi:hypothetical protein LHFGNBLO_001482 [Mesorhizobium sp. AR10]|uniref:hypothetical protein n=1 Tax=Mesorhizobium sp. AR10 TaxID=2865839 RepID=UPI00216020ED|nr:hypothetical protein [Mesorhizobium sp. AR10]UVK40055.1 hypothetical protein LHFGNBLO_001482 [Mesorhizobium sp. AR10]
MADFVAVLKKTIDGLGETTPEVRARVYDKARSTIAGKLAAITPPPPPSVADRQKRALEDAILSVERDYAKSVPASDPLAELEHIFSSIDRNKNQSSHTKPPVKTEPALQPAPAAKAEPNWQKASQAPSPFDPADNRLPDFDAARNDKGDVFANDGDPGADTFQRLRPAERKRSYGGLIAAVGALLVVAGGGYGIWLNKDAFSAMFGLGGDKVATTEPLVKPAPAKPAADAAAPAAAVTAEGTKFTQRLTPEGGEVDPGPAAGQSGIGEGESVAALTTPPPAAPAPATPAAPAGDAAATTAVPGTAPVTPPADTAAPATPGAAPATPPAEGAAPAAPADAAAPAAGAAPAAPTAAPAETTLPVGQKAIFYEERTSTAQGSAEPGSIVWSLVQESPGGDLPPEPAIRAEATIPGKDIQLRMTIRRNTDQTLPASHIIEMIFLTPEGFDGGGVDNILRVAMKSSEQDAGSPLIGIPAKIADGFFLVALNDTKADEDANLTLLRGQDWIDVPVVYKTGRRALLTMEKGIPGEKVFDEALKAWQAKTAG